MGPAFRLSEKSMASGAPLDVGEEATFADGEMKVTNPRTVVQNTPKDQRKTHKFSARILTPHCAIITILCAYGVGAFLRGSSSKTS